jgi:UDP-N-acetylmuramoylalanine--D-glutamate ligase
MVATSRTGQWNVLELSSFQLETTETFRAYIGACLNVTPDHLDRHYTLENYAEMKARLFVRQRDTDLAVLNADDAICRGYAYRGGSKPTWFSSTQTVAPGACVCDGRIMLDGEPLMSTAEVPLRGMHNIENTMAAAVIARMAGASHDQIRAAVISFPGVEHRLEFVRELNGVAWYNDSKATNVDATLKAIDAFPGGLWIILGGKDKNSDYTLLAPALRAKAHAALLIGAAAAKIRGQLEGSIPLVDCSTIEGAVKIAFERAQPGDTVLLAPACASFDQFTSYEHRGREFKRLVRELAWPN